MWLFHIIEKTILQLLDLFSNLYQLLLVLKRTLIFLYVYKVLYFVKKLKYTSFLIYLKFALIINQKTDCNQ